MADPGWRLFENDGIISMSYDVIVYGTMVWTSKEIFLDVLQVL